MTCEVKLPLPVVTTTFTSGLGYGWTAGTRSSLDRGIGSDLTRDFVFSADMTFAVNIANGTYAVTIMLGDAGPYAHDLQGVYLEGTQVDSVSTAAGQVVTKTYTVTVSDGQLNLRLLDLVTQVASSRSTISSLAPAMMPPTATEAEISAPVLRL